MCWPTDTYKMSDFSCVSVGFPLTRLLAQCYFIEIWVKLDCAIRVSWWRKLTSQAKAAMQILLQNHSVYKIGIIFLHSFSLPTLYPHPALVTPIPHIIRLEEETAVPRKSAQSVLINMGSHERAGNETVRAEEDTVKNCINPSPDLLLLFKNLSSCKAYWFLYWGMLGTVFSNLWHLSTLPPSGTSPAQLPGTIFIFRVSQHVLSFPHSSGSCILLPSTWICPVHG